VCRTQKKKRDYYFLSKSTPTFLLFTLHQLLFITIQIKKSTTKLLSNFFIFFFFHFFIQNILTFFFFFFLTSIKSATASVHFIFQVLWQTHPKSFTFETNPAMEFFLFKSLLQLLDSCEKKGFLIFLFLFLQF
jgi:hypothetical protein